MPVPLEAKGVKKTYGMGKVLVPALQEITFDVKEGEFVAVFGPSGSGKSTILHVLGGLDRPDEGEVLVDGIGFSTLNDNALAEVRLRKIGFSPLQQNHMFQRPEVERMAVVPSFHGSGQSSP